MNTLDWAVGITDSDGVKAVQFKIGSFSILLSPRRARLIGELLSETGDALEYEEAGIDTQEIENDWREVSPYTGCAYTYSLNTPGADAITEENKDEFAFAFENLYKRLAPTSTISKEELYNVIFGRRPTGN